MAKQAFRHWETKWLDEARHQGKLTLFPPAKYRDIEQSLLQDDLELSTRHHIDRIHIRNDVIDEEKVAHLRAATVGAAGGENIVLEGLDIEHRMPDGYVFCMSKVDTKGLFDDGRAAPYDAVTLIPDVEELARALAAAAPPGLVRGIKVGDVRYVPREYVVGEEPVVLPPNPFLKPERFRPNQEVRMFLEVRGPVDINGLPLQSDTIATLFSRWPSQ